MARIEKTVFISYRRTDRWPAVAVFKDLTHHGYDVFIDYDGIASGDFERTIVENIRARAHFLVLLTPAALERCDDPKDWVRREIETAIEARRNIVPLLLNGFTFNEPIAVQRLQGTLQPLPRYQALTVHEDYFDAVMGRLRDKFLSVPVDAVLHPPSSQAREAAREQYQAASKAEAPPQPVRAPNVSDAKPRLGLVVIALIVAAAVGWGVFSHGQKTASMQPPTPVTTPDAEASYALGESYYYGRDGHAQDDIEAVKWYRKAADLGYAPAQNNLGWMYENGRGGLPKDDSEAVNWYRKAAEQGIAIGQYNLGVMYEGGRGGLSKDSAEAVNWYGKAAAQGYEHAQQALNRLGKPWHLEY